jgi:hypothetical protein
MKPNKKAHRPDKVSIGDASYSVSLSYDTKRTTVVARISMIVGTYTYWLR